MAEMPDSNLPPWEQQDAMRRDYEPHRGALLHFMAGAALAAGGLAIFCGPCGLVGLPLGVIAWHCARRDLKELEAGVMDPAGKPVTYEAVFLGQIGAAISLVALVVWTCIIAALLDG